MPSSVTVYILQKEAWINIEKKIYGTLGNKDFINYILVNVEKYLNGIIMNGPLYTIASK